MQAGETVHARLVEQQDTDAEIIEGKANQRRSLFNEGIERLSWIPSTEADKKSVIYLHPGDVWTFVVDALRTQECPNNFPAAHAGSAGGAVICQGAHR